MADIFKSFEDEVINSNELNEDGKRFVLKKLTKLREKEINIMITGATGCGKSSTINALFETEKAKVGIGVDPETMDIQKYELDKLILWDTPGLGDGKEKDVIHAKNIISKLHEKDKDGNALIDLVLVILDGGSRDLGTSYELINSVIIPALGEDRKDRILVAINQADMAMKGKYWNAKLNKPEEKLKNFLDEKVKSVRKRIKEGSGIDVDPIYYCAGYKEEGEEQCQPYNLTKLLYYIIKNTPKEKRLVYMNNTNNDQEVWKRHDEIIDYEKEIKKSFFETVEDCISVGTDLGSEIGSIFGETGRKVGGFVGGVVGGVIGIVKGIFD